MKEQRQTFKLLVFPGNGKGANGSHSEHESRSNQHLAQKASGRASDKRGRDAPNFVTYRGIVYPHQCDHMGYMNVMWYVGKFDEASWQLLSLIGLTTSRMEKDNLTAAAIVQHNYYKRKLYAGDGVTVRSAIVEVKEKTIRMRHEMTHDESGELAAASTIVSIQLDACSKKARSLPRDVRERVSALMGIEGASRSNDHRK